MSVIHNIDLIKNLLSQTQLERLEKHAVFFEQRNKIQFGILDVSNDSVTIGVSQRRAPKVFIAAPRELMKVAKSLFWQFIEDRRLDIKIGEYSGQGDTFVELKPVKRTTLKEAPKPKVIAKPIKALKEIIGNGNLIEHFLNPEKIEKMIQHAAFFAERNGVYFSVLEVKDNEIRVSAQQKITRQGMAIRTKELDTICKSFFEFYLEGKHILLEDKNPVNPKKAPKTPETIKQELAAKGITIEQIAKETGVNPLTLSAWLDGRQGMSALAKAMFHYMLK